MSEASDATADGSAAPAPGAPFDALLLRLRSDGDAGAVYESLRRRLIRFFRLHVPAEADELADVTFERLAQKLREGTEISQVPLYALGIARMVLLETRVRAARRDIAEADPTLVPDADASADDAEDAAAHATVMNALSTCLDAAGAAERTLILAYYAADGSERIAIRQRLAAEQQISLNALRNRALRLRGALEQCVRKRLGWPGSA